MSTLNGWHPGERIVHHKLGHDSNLSIMGQYQNIDCDLPADHAKFHSTRLPFLPITTLDSAGRPWGSILAGKDGKPGFIKNSRYTVLSVEAKVWPGEPLLETAVTFGKGEMLVAGIGIEFSTRRRNKFAGKVTRLERHTETISMDLTVNEAIGNCPKYINLRDLVSHPTTYPKVVHQQLHLSQEDRLPSPLISFIHATDTVFFGTTYAAPSPEASKFPSHLGMNQRGGRPGFLRVMPSDGRTVVLPDYSGNRYMTSLGNVEATPLASLTFVSFTTGAILYLTGSASNLFGDAASTIMPFQQRVTAIRVSGYTFVEDALPVRQRPRSEVERSPYSPPVKLLVGEMGEGRPLSLSNSGKVQALLKSVVLHSSNIATFVWQLSSATQPPSSNESPHVSIRPGQAAILDFTSFLGQPAYQHMAPLKPSAVNDDRIRTWTVSLSSTWGRKGNDFLQDPGQVFELTMREKPGGAVTGALFTLARKLVSVGRKDLLDDMGPLDIKVGFVGVSGEFVLPVPIGVNDLGRDVDEEPEMVVVPKPLLNMTAPPAAMEKTLLWAAGGIGITPFLAMLTSLVSNSNPNSSTATAVSWSINLILATREPEVTIPLLSEALWRMRTSETAAAKTKIKLMVDAFSQKLIPDLEGAADGEGEIVEIELRRHMGRIGDVFFEGLAQKMGDGVGFTGTEAYVCGPEGFETMVVNALVRFGAERGRIRREGFAY